MESNMAGCDGDSTFTTPPLAPDVTSESATAITTTGATLGALVNPGNGATSVTFQYGTSAAYGSTTPVVDVPSGTVDKPVSLVVTGLAPGTMYHARAVAHNAGGDGSGQDFTFTTVASNAFTVASVRAKRSGKLIITLLAPNAGAFRARATRHGHRYGAASATAAGAGTVRLTIKPRHKPPRGAKIKVTITFSPLGVSPLTATVHVKVPK
jgi:hypothetical protein